MNDHEIPLPLSYRSELLQQVMPALGAGECCSLVGAGGAGKSNLVRFLQRPDVQTAYWGDNPIWVVAIDTHSLVFGEQPEAYIVIELMIHRLIRETERRNLSDEFLEELDRKHTHLVEHPNAQLALRYLERICGLLCERLGVRLIFVFDQFEDLWSTLHARLFLNLRSLRDEFKYRLVYLVMTRERLGRVRQRTQDDLAAVEAFCELFTSHTYGLSMYAVQDADYMLERIAKRREMIVSNELRELTIRMSGGHSGLLRAILWALHSQQQLLEAIELLQIDTVCDECTKLWNDLLPEEQDGMRLIAAGVPLPAHNATLADLKLKGLLVDTAQEIFSPLFSVYVQRKYSGDMHGIVVAPRLRQVWLDGQPLERTLAPLEFRLLVYLVRRTGEICSREDILRELYQEQYINANDERLDTLLRRLREALHEDARNPRYLHTHRGVGIQLAEGRMQE